MIGLHISKKQKYKELNHSCIKKKCGIFNVALSFHEIDYRQVYYENEKVIVFVDGWIFNSDSYKTQAEFVAINYLQNNEQIMNRVEGQFNLFIYDKVKSSSIFLNDIFAFRKHFILPKSFVISTDLKFLYSHLKQITFNKDHIRRNLNQNRYIDIRQTFVNEVNMITPASLIDFKKQKEYSLFEFEQKYLNKKRNITALDFVEEVKDNIKDVHRNTPVLLQLSGGMDSRFLIEIFKTIDIPIKCISYGTLKSDEIIIAKEVAKVNMVDITLVEYIPADYINGASDYSLLMGGLDIFVQSAFVKNRRQLKSKKFNNHIIDTGIGLNNFIGGTQMKNKNNATSHNFTNHKFDLSDNDIYTSKLRIFSQLVLRQKFHREFMEDRYAMFSYKNYFLMKSIPYNQLSDYKFYLSIAELSIKNSKDVNIQATMTPFYVSPTFNEVSALKAREMRSLDLFLNKEKKVPHNRYYSDFDMWLRSESSWIEIINKTILAPGSYISNFISEKIIRDIVEKHNNGIKPNMRLLIRMISTELFLKETDKYND